MQLGPSREFPSVTSVATAKSTSPMQVSTRSIQSQSFAQVMGSIGERLDRGEAGLQRALSPCAGTSADPAELIALQARIYRYTETLELCTRVIDRGTQAIRTTLQQSG
jgi:hypothetical protein